MAKHNTSNNQLNQQQKARRREIYRYTATEPLYASSWSNIAEGQFRMAVGTIIEGENMHINNKVIQFLCLFISYFLDLYY